MDWSLAIERNRAALARLLAMIVAMADRGGASLPRRFHRALCRLVLPAEAAARRLVILVASGLVVALPPLRPRKPKPRTPGLARRAGGTVTQMPCAPGGPCPAPARLALPLFDPLWRPRPRRITPRGIPRLSVPGFTTPFAIPPRPSPDDPVTALRLRLRLAALAAALDDLPAAARRFACWRARRDMSFAQGPVARRPRRIAPLRPGRPPGQRPAGGPRPVDEIHEVLDNLHGLAVDALARHDTS